MFIKKIEELKQNHVLEIERNKLENQKIIEYIRKENDILIESIKAEKAALLESTKAEIAAWLSDKENIQNINKSKELEIFALRAAKFPSLISSLRRMKNIINALYFSVKDDEPELAPINLESNSEDANLVFDAIVDLGDLYVEFENNLSDVRMFTKRSDFDFPIIVKNFVDKWKNADREIFSISQDEMDRFATYYADDLAYLTGEFYGWPENKQFNAADELESSRHRKLIERLLK